MVFDFDFEDPFEDGAGTRPLPQRRWAVSCDPAPVTRNKAPRPARQRKKSKGPDPASSYQAVQQGLEGLELPPHLLNYGVKHKYDFAGPSLLGIENDEGKVEYKLQLKPDLPSNRFHQLVSQLKFRLAEGEGECFYLLGVEDNGHPKGLPPHELEQSLAVLHRMAGEAGAGASLLSTPEGEGGQRRCAVVRVQQRCLHEEVGYEDLRVAVAGGVDSGKSTLVAVLTHGSGGRPLLDNGRGSARMNVFRHKHEIESGHTSSVTEQMVGYDAGGQVINYVGVAHYTPPEVALCAARVVRFVDTGGHEKYSKTALAGLTSMLPDYSLLCVCSTAGVSWATRDHLAVTLALGVPAFLALTKVDLAADEVWLDNLVHDIRCLMAAALGLRADAPDPSALEALAPVVESEQEARQLAPRMLRSRIGARVAGAGADCQEEFSESQLLVPIFKVSSVTGRGIAALHAFLHALRPEVDLAAGAGPAAPGPPGAEPAGRAGAGARADGRTAAAEAAAAEAISAVQPAAAEAAPAKRGAAATAAAEAIGLGSLSLGEGAHGAAASSCWAQGLAQGWLQLPGSFPAGSPPAAATAIAPKQPAEASPPSEGAVQDTLGGTPAAWPGAPAGTAQPAANEPVHFVIDHSLFVTGVGPVYSGRVVSGTLHVGSRVLLGPCHDGWSGGGGKGFCPVKVVGLHRSQLAVQCIIRGQIATVAVEVEGPQPQAAIGSPAGAASAAAPGGSGNSGAAAAAPPVSSGSTAGAASAAAPAGSGSVAGAASAGAGARPGSLGRELAIEALATDAAQEEEAPAGASALAAAAAAVAAPWAAAAATGTAGQPGIALPDLAGTAWDLSEHLGSPVHRAAAGHHSYSRPPFPKGSVLLSPELEPEPCWEFEALLVLLGGQWPARGLMSGSWPPLEEEALPSGRSASQEVSPVLGPFEGAASLRSTGSGPLQSRGSGKRREGPSVYTAVVHCGSTHQAARIMSIQELPLPLPSSPDSPPASQLAPAAPAVACQAEGFLPEGSRILPAIAAARLLRADGWVPSGAGLAGAGGGVSQGSLIRHLGSSPAAAAAAAHGVPMAQPGSDRSGAVQREGQLRQSPADSSSWVSSHGVKSQLVGSQGALSSADSLALSYASSDSYDSSTSEGGPAAAAAAAGSGSCTSGRGRWRRVGWAQGLAGDTPSCEDVGREGLTSPGASPLALPPAAAQGLPAEGQGRPLARHRSVTDARQDPDLGCLARVRLRFVKRPEWLVPGARLVLRDRGIGRAAAVGFVLSAAPAGAESSSA